MVCKFLKALNGPKQLPCYLYKRLSSFFLERLRLKPINLDNSIFDMNAGLDRPVISMFVYDIKIMASKKQNN